jgi:hypothetical protein
MSDIREELRRKWQEARSATRGGSEWRAIAVAVPSSVRVLAGIREADDRIALLLEAPLDERPPAVFRLQADGITVLDDRRQDEGLLRLSVTLERRELHDVFEVLAADLADVVRAVASPAAALRVAFRRLEAWQACLRVRRRGLSREEQVGLMGELIVYGVVAEEIGHGRTLEAWCGPLGGVHDFNRIGTSIEVKSVVGVSSHLRISALNQLETTGLEALALARPRFREAIEGQTLGEMVDDMRRGLDREAPEHRGSFDDRLLRAGHVDTDRDRSESIRLGLEELHGYVVRDGFPRLTAATVPGGIVEVGYSIDERSIAAFRIDLQGLRTVAREMAKEGP